MTMCPHPTDRRHRSTLIAPPSMLCPAPIITVVTASNPWRNREQDGGSSNYPGNGRLLLPKN